MSATMKEHIPYRTADPAKQCQHCAWFYVERNGIDCCTAPRNMHSLGLLVVPPWFTCGLWKERQS
jgi:hypothetical protein